MLVVACTAGADLSDGAGQESGLGQSAAAVECSVWKPTWAQGSGANSWWAEFTVSGSVASAYLEVPGRANYPLTLLWNTKWTALTGEIAPGATVVLHAGDAAGNRAQTEPFRYLVDIAPRTADCPQPPDGCAGAWEPSWNEGSGANEWWVEFAIGGAVSAELEITGRSPVPLVAHWEKWAASTPKIDRGVMVVLRAQGDGGRRARTQPFRYLVDRAPKTEPCTGNPTGDPRTPDTFAAAEVDVVSTVRTEDARRAISPLIYGLNSIRAEGAPADVLAGVSFIRRGGDRANAYNWETNVSNGSHSNGFVNDHWLAGHLANPNAPGELDRVLIAQSRAAGRGAMVPFVLNQYVAGPLGAGAGFDQPGFDITRDFRRVELVKPTPFAAVPDPNDGVVYTDEHIDFLRRSASGDMFAAGPTQVMVGTDNEPDLYAHNFPMLQRGTGRNLLSPRGNGVVVGRQVTADEFTQRFITFARRVKGLWPTAPIVGPDHYHFDGFTTWWDTETGRYSGAGRWYMDDFLASVRDASAASGRRLLDTWDFHWYPQRVFNGTYAWALDDAKRKMTAEEIDAVVQGPRSYWDSEYDEQSWITRDHLRGPATIVTRLQGRIDTGYAGTGLGVTEYFPGGCAHVSSALGIVDTLGVFGRSGLKIAALWPHSCDLRWAYGGFKLLRNTDGQGLAFANTSVRVEHPEKAPSSVYAASDASSRVTVLVVNKTNASRRFGVRVANPTRLATVDVWRVDAASPDPVFATRASLTKNNAYAYAAPPMSATLLVFKAP